MIVVAVLGYGLYRLVEWPGFALKHVDVRGAHETSRDEILHRAAFGPHPNMWLIDFGAARARIEALPYVKTATLMRLPPDTIAISIAERTPVGCLIGLGDAEALVDAKLRVLSDACPEGSTPAYRAPVAVTAPGTFIHDAAVAQLVGDAAALRAAGTTFVALRHDRFGQLEATLNGGVIVRFGDETGLASKARMVAPILSTATQQLGPVESIDLRATATPVVRYRSSGPAPVEPKAW